MEEAGNRCIKEVEDDKNFIEEKQFEIQAERWEEGRVFHMVDTVKKGVKISK